MRKTKNLTLAITEQAYREARIHAAERNQSLSSFVQFVVEHLPQLTKAVSNLKGEDPTFTTAKSAARRHQRKRTAPQSLASVLADSRLD